MSHSVLRVGFVGTGYIADYHAAAVKRLHMAKLCAACDRNEARLGSFARRHDVPAAYTSLEAMLEQSKPDVVHVLTLPDSHMPLARTALDAGTHVLVEKPMATTAKDCDVLIETATQRGLTVGVNHNFLFYPVYEQLRSDIKSGKLGRIDSVSILWCSELNQIAAGPFDQWMLRDPGNVILEIGAHTIGQLLDLVGLPDDCVVKATDPVEIPGHRQVYRQWRIMAECRGVAVDFRFRFTPGFSERGIMVRGSFGTAHVDFDRNTYVLQRHSRLMEDFDRYQQTMAVSRSLRKQGRLNILRYMLSKLKLSDRGNPYAFSIARSVQTFYDGLGAAPDPRLTGSFGREVIRVCHQVVERAGVEVPVLPAEEPPCQIKGPAPRILILGGTGYIGRELVRQILDKGYSVRLMTRNRGSVPFETNTLGLEVVEGRIQAEEDVLKAIEGIETVFHLARAVVKTWDEYYRQDVLATQLIAECCLKTGVKRLIYTGTIASYYAGARAGAITETTPLDPRIHRRDNYSRAKALSEELLMQMQRERGLPVVIFRPGIVIGKGSSPCHWGVGMWNGPGVVQLWGDGRNKLPFVLLDDVVHGLIAGMEVSGIEGESFNLVAPPCLSGLEYVEALERSTDVRVQVYPTPIWRFYAADMAKWLIKVMVRHPERRRPSYRDWESRTARAVFDCAAAMRRLGWAPVSDRDRLAARGIGGLVGPFKGPGKPT